MVGTSCAWSDGEAYVHPIGRSWARMIDMDSAPKRPWYRLHWGTVLTVFFVLVGWAGQVFPGITTFWHLRLRFPGFLLEFVEGWPMSSISVNAGAIVTDVVALAVDGIFLMACIASVVFVVERLEYAGLRLSISTMLTFVAAVAVVFGFLRWNEQLLNNLPAFGTPFPNRSYVPLNFDYTSSHIGIPVLFALVCLAYTVFWLALRAASWPFSRLRRPVPAHIEADGGPRQ